MKFVVRKISHADLDAAEAARWHEQQQPGLGLRFLDAVDAAVQIHHSPPGSACRQILRRLLRPVAHFQNLRRLLRHSWR